MCEIEIELVGEERRRKKKKGRRLLDFSRSPTRKGKQAGQEERGGLVETFAVWVERQLEHIVRERQVFEGT